MSKIISFSVVDILEALLDKSKTQTIRPIKYKEIHGKVVNLDGSLTDSIEYKKIGISFGAEKPPRFKVKEKVKLMWKQRSKYKIFYKQTGEGTDGDWTHTIFPKKLGEGEITEVFKITMGLDKGQGYIQADNLDWINAPNDLARANGFNSFEKMMFWFDKMYDLSGPKQFWVTRWKWF